MIYDVCVILLCVICGVWYMRVVCDDVDDEMMVVDVNDDDVDDEMMMR